MIFFTPIALKYNAESTPIGPKPTIRTLLCSDFLKDETACMETAKGSSNAACFKSRDLDTLINCFSFWIENLAKPPSFNSPTKPRFWHKWNLFLLQ